MAKKANKSVMFSSSPPKSLLSPLPSLTSPLNQTFSNSTIDKTVEAAESIIKKWDPNSPSYTKITSLFTHSRKEAKEFIKCIHSLRKAMHFLLSQRSQPSKLALAHNLMRLAMSRLEKEFLWILSSNRDQLDPESVSAQSSISSNSEFEDYFMQSDDDDNELKKASESISKVEKASALVMSDLKVIAETMISCGYGKECVKSYKLVRKSIVDQGLHLLGIENRKIKNWTEPMIKIWIKAAKIGVVTLFRGEKVLCDYVFSSSSTLRESCFYEIANEAGINLFRFPDLVANKVKKPPHERIFALMDLYAAMSELKPDVEVIFHADVTTLALSSMKKLKDSIRNCLDEFESTIQKDSSKANGGVHIHKLTISAMSFISSLSEYSRVLSEILTDHPLRRNTRLLESYFTAPILEDEEVNNHAFSVHLAWLVLVLLCKLDIKAESCYKDVSFSYLFLVNNVQFVVDTVRATTQLRNLLGDDWLAKHEAKLRSYAANYEVAAWGNVFLSLQEKRGDSNTTTTLSPLEAKACFKRFHMAFEEAYMKQSLCVVSNAKLREEIKGSIRKRLVLEYREFYGKYLPILRQEETVVRFRPDDLENYVSDLFQGTPMLNGSSSSSSSSSSCISIGCVRN